MNTRKIMLKIKKWCRFSLFQFNCEKRHHFFWLMGILFFLTTLSYSNGLQNKFLMDDHAFLTRRHSDIKFFFHQFIPDKNKVLKIESRKTDHSYYKPLTHMIPILYYYFFNKNPLNYHIINIILY